MARSERTALEQFADALLALFDDPGPENMVRYLAASRALEDSQRLRHADPSQRRSKAAADRVARRAA